MRLLLAAAALAATILPAVAQTGTAPNCPVNAGGGGAGCNAVVTTSAPQQIILPPNGAGTLNYSRIIYEGSSGGVAWCNRHGAPQVAANGSFPIAPWGNSLGYPSVEEFAGPGTSTGQPPQFPMSCISDGGTSGTATANLSVEVR